MKTESIKTLVPPQVYTNRQEHLDYFYNYALSAIPRRAMSTVLLGQRRMGKTEIFKRVVNRLFFEQDHTDPKALVPVYYSFKDDPPNKWDFAIQYVENFLRWYIAFRLQDISIISTTTVSKEQLPDFIKANLSITPGLKGALALMDALTKQDVTLPQEAALVLPRRVSDRDDSTIVMFLDEFQNIRLPEHKYSLVGFMQEAVESPTCPHFVTGSAMSILAKEIIGRGALFGRFMSKVIEPLTSYYGTELAINAANHYGAELPVVMAPIVANRCGNNPFYITAVIQQAVLQNRAIVNEDALNQILAVDISSGFIWGELNDQVNRWIKRINDHHITKWILYLSALEEEEKININRIQQALKEKEGQDVSVKVIQDVLIRLSRGDLVEYLELGDWFRKVKDPILLEFLKVWGRIDVEGYPYDTVQFELRTHYKTLKKQITEYKGYVAEVFIAQVLWSAQRKTLAGKYFNHPDNIKMPHLFSFVRHRMRLGSGKGQEIDVIGAAAGDIWVCESKWWENKQVDVDVLETLLKQSETAKQTLKALEVTTWLFAYSGLTEEAEAYAKEHSILWSTRDQLNELLTHLHLRQLPEL